MIVPVREPYDWDRLLDWLGTRAIPGLEAVEDGVYVRGDVRVARVAGGIEVTGAADPVVVARVFDSAHDPTPLTDPLFARAPGIRVPGAWSGWELAVRAVLGQQVSVAGARSTAHKLVELHGGGAFPAPEALIDGALPGMPASRARALRALAAAVAGGLVLDPPLDRARTRAQLLALPGFGPWTVEYIAMRALRDPDAWPASDLWLRRAATPEQAERWRPWRAYAAMVIFQT